MSKPLFRDDEAGSSDEEQISLKVNKRYAKDYEERKQREELLNADPRDLREGEDGSSSSSESEDEDGELMNDVSFVKTLKAIRERDASIYDSSKKFGEEIVIEKHDPNRKKRKVFKDVVREQVLEQMEEEEGKISKKTRDDKKSHLEYDAEQKNLRKAFLNGDSDDQDESDLLVVKKRAHQVENDPELQNEFEELAQSTANADLQDPRGEIENGEKFLINFLKNRKWKDNDLLDDNDDSHDAHQRFRSGANDDDGDSIDDVDRADNFEARYNFRFEEAESAAQSGADFSVIGYARSGTMNTLRRSEDTRKQKRQERKERKAAERKAKEEQLRRLKNAKRQEMQKKLKDIKQVIGEDEHMDEEAMLKLMEGDFDPNKFEELMQKQYDDNFYAKEDAQWKSDVDVRTSLLQDDEGKSLVVDADEEDGGQYDLQEDDDGDEQYDAGAEDDDDDQPLFEDNEEEEATEMEKKLKEKMQDELYKLDYEDIIAGMPTRFKYRKVEPNSYGLSTKEILFARDASLKNFVSLKKMAPYRDDGEYQVGYKKRRRFRDMLGEDLEEMEAEAQKQQEEEGEKKKKRRRQKKNKKKDVEEDNIAATDKEEVKEGTDNGEEPKKKRRRRKKSKNAEKTDDADADKVPSPPNETTLENKEEKVSDAEKKKKKSKKEKKHRRYEGKNPKRVQKVGMAGVSASRLSAYGL